LHAAAEEAHTALATASATTATCRAAIGVTEAAAVAAAQEVRAASLAASTCAATTSAQRGSFQSSARKVSILAAAEVEAKNVVACFGQLAKAMGGVATEVAGLILHGAPRGGKKAASAA